MKSLKTPNIQHPPEPTKKQGNQIIVVGNEEEQKTACIELPELLTAFCFCARNAFIIAVLENQENEADDAADALILALLLLGGSYRENVLCVHAADEL